MKFLIQICLKALTRTDEWMFDFSIPIAGSGIGLILIIIMVVIIIRGKSSKSVVKKAVNSGDGDDVERIIEDDDDIGDFGDKKRNDTEEFIDFSLATACHVDGGSQRWCEAKVSLGSRKITSI